MLNSSKSKNRLSHEYSKLSLSVIDVRIKPRHVLNQEFISRYAGEMEKGTQFSPLTVFYDGQNYWLSDGYHRFYAAKLIDCKSLYCQVCSGTQRDAVLNSVSSDVNRIWKPTKTEKRFAVKKILSDPEWSTWSDRKIGRQCGVSHTLVAKIRKETGVTSSSMNNKSPNTRSVTRKGKDYSMKVSNIGQSQA